MNYQMVLEKRAPFAARYFREVASYRHLALNLAASDLRTRFRRSYLGILWAMIQPLGFSLVLGWVWGTLFNYPNVWSYALYIFAGLVVWEYFSNVFLVSQESLINADGYLKQTRIPFIVFQGRVVLTGLVIALTGTIGLLLMLLIFQKFPPLGLHLLLVPFSFVAMIALFTPIAIIMSILGTTFRDLKHASTVLVQALFFLSPVMLPRGALSPDKMALLNRINPVAELINMYRSPLVDGTGWTGEQVATLALWCAGLWALALILSIRAGRKLIFAI